MSEDNNTTSPSDIRTKLDQALAAKEGGLAKALMAELWALHPGPATAPLILSGFKALSENGIGVSNKPLRLSILRSFSVEPVIPLLKAAALLGHIDLDVKVGEFNTYAQEILSPEGQDYDPKTDVVILAVQTRDIAPDFWQGEKIDQSRIRQIISEFTNLIEAFRSRSDAYLIVHNLQQPPWAADGVLDAQSAQSQRNCISEINSGLVQAAANCRDVHILDYDSLVSRLGRDNWSDESRWLTMRLPIAMENLRHLADEWLKFITPISSRIAKALIVDLDNTLWGGVLGEEGVEGLQLDGEYPGAAFQAVQRVLLDLSRRGIILGICSKNDEEAALRAMKDHPGMILKPENFSALRINWQDKATNLKSIAEELNIGTDAIAFLDDNPAERLLVRQSLPEVSVIELSDDPLTYAEALRAAPVFERLRVSSEDKERSRHYAEQRQRNTLQASVTSLEEFYQSLEMKLDVFPVGPADIARVAQLTQKTNQFNLTTRRYSETDIARFIEAPDQRVLAARVTDRFGDSGIIAVIIIETKESSARLDTFLMSCRVIGRTVETAILAIIAEQLHDTGASTLMGEFIPTEKNTPARNFLAEHGFRADKDDKLVLHLPAPTLQVPAWVKT